MSLKLSLSFIYFLILFSITIYITSCINSFSNIYKCHDNETMIDGIKISSGTINIVLWLYVSSEFLISLCIGVLIGLNIAKKIENLIAKISVTTVIFLNIIKIVLFSLLIILYKKCAGYYDDIQMYLIIYFFLNVLVLGLSECLLANLLMQNSENNNNTLVSIPIEYLIGNLKSENNNKNVDENNKFGKIENNRVIKKNKMCENRINIPLLNDENETYETNNLQKQNNMDRLSPTQNNSMIEIENK